MKAKVQSQHNLPLEAHHTVGTEEEHASYIVKAISSLKCIPCIDTHCEVPRELEDRHQRQTSEE
jgi:hypothetical protein